MLLTIALPSPMPRSWSDLGLNSPRILPIRTNNSSTAEDDSVSIETLAAQFPPTPRENKKIISDIDDEILSWQTSGDTRGSQDTQSTYAQPTHTSPAVTFASILRHQRQDSNETVKSASKQFSELELRYLNYVLETLYHLIVEAALDKSGVQYRNTFAWKFHVRSLVLKLMVVGEVE
jgi:hypothetical protein